MYLFFFIPTPFSLCECYTLGDFSHRNSSRLLFFFFGLTSWIIDGFVLVLFLLVSLSHLFSKPRLKIEKKRGVGSSTTKQNKQKAAAFIAILGKVQIAASFSFDDRVALPHIRQGTPPPSFFFFFRLYRAIWNNREKKTNKNKTRSDFCFCWLRKKQKQRQSNKKNVGQNVLTRP